MQLTTSKRHHTARIRHRLALVFVVVLAATAALAGAAKAQVGLPNGGAAAADISCDPALTDFNIVLKYSGPGSTYAMLWVYSYPDGKWHSEVGWTKLSSAGDLFTAFYDNGLAGSWVAMYTQYATFVNGRWNYSGEWVQMLDNNTNQTDYWCGF
jgi:hypothetical protein